jgi:hypothetical protein
LINGAPGALDTLNELASALGDDANFAATVTNSLALKAALASPAFSGVPTAPTPSGSDNSTAIATTAFVRTLLAAYATLASPTFTGTPAAPTPSGTDNSTAIATTAFVQSLVASVARAPGDLLLTLDAAAPTGFVELNGATITGGVATYPSVSSRYSWMKSGANLILPDFRGQFMRIWAHGSSNDPDRAGRTARAGDGTTGDNPGTNQAHAMQSHTHDAASTSFVYSNSAGVTAAAAGTGSSTWGIAAKTGPVSTTANTSTETRPININVSAWMKMG